MKTENTIPILDCRRRGVRQTAVTARFPAEVVDRLEQLAQQLDTNRTALTRALVLRGLSELEGSQG